MGKNLNHTNLVQRTGKLAFCQVGSTYYRMEGFTDLGYSKNPKEYSRQYVDEDFERNSVVGYSPSISYSFDKYKGNSVLEQIVKIAEDELIGARATISIITVDMSTANTVNGKGSANAKRRSYSVIPDTFGDTTDCLTYSGNFKACGVVQDVFVSTVNDWDSLSEVLVQTEKSTTATITVTGDGVENEITTSGNYTSASGNVRKGTVCTISAVADFTGAFILITNGKNILASGQSEVSCNTDLITSGDNIYNVLVTCGDEKKTYQITLKSVEA